MSRTISLLGGVASASLLAGLAFAQTRPATPQVPATRPGTDKAMKAVCHLTALGESGASGTVWFTEQKGAVHVKAEITGLTPGKHGFHIHEFGDCSAPDGKSAGGHFNPMDMPHAGPGTMKRHAGDLGNIEADESGSATLELTDPGLSFAGATSILGRGMIVHAQPDDLTTQPTGNAGGRVACGVIGVAP